MDHDIAAFDEIAEGSMRKIEIDGRALLLARAGGVCHVIDNVCPHAGAPLDEGVLDGDVVICPWHKAAFSVVTGKNLEPPAVDDVARFDVRVENGRVLVAKDDAAPRACAATSALPDDRCFAIIGAGAAGAVAAQTLRSQGFGGRLLLIGTEAELPYDRTVLSKYTLAGTQGDEKTPLQTAAFYSENSIERIVGTVDRIDHASRIISLAAGETIAYSSALLATGGAARRLNVEGESLHGVFSLRSAADARAIAMAASHATSAVVAGSGFIAMEAAASLRQRGLDVTVIAPQTAPFERQLGTEIGNFFRRLLEREGVVFRLEETIEAIIGSGSVERVQLRSGADIAADIVIVGTGISPATGMLPRSLLRDDGGIDVNARLQVSDGLFAAGDIAAFPLRGDGARVRVEHWRVAQQHGRVAALNMLGIDTAFEAVPYFWTTYFSKRLDYVGLAESWDEIIIDGDLDKPDFAAFYLQSGKVAAVAGVGRDKQMAEALAVLTRQRDVTMNTLRAKMKAVA